MRVALLQLTSGDDPAANLAVTRQLVRRAADGGAQLILTPEVTNCVSTSRSHQAMVLQGEDQDTTLSALRAETAATGVPLLIGSLALQSGDPDGRFVNRSFLISSTGEIAARYDKMHMFDVTISDTESYAESKGYRAGQAPCLTQVADVPLGMTICYDLRFPYLFRHLALLGARIIAVPSAFAVATGQAHWEVLLRARAIENGCFILAPAQVGQHPIAQGRARATYGHSMVVAPWGEVLLDAGTETGVFFCDLDLDAVGSARGRIPSLTHDRPMEPPDA